MSWETQRVSRENFNPEQLQTCPRASWYLWFVPRFCRLEPCSCWAPPTWPSVGTWPWCCCPQSHKFYKHHLCRSEHVPLSGQTLTERDSLEMHSCLNLIIKIQTWSTQDKFSIIASTSVASLRASFSMSLMTPVSRTVILPPLARLGVMVSLHTRLLGRWRLGPGSSLGLGL